MNVVSRTAATNPAARSDRHPRRLTVDNPAAYIAGDRRRALGTGATMPDRVSGAALFADISGFTPLTEALVAENGAQRGAEELTRTLDIIFDAVLGQLHRFGGSVIYFSGDAVTCWLDGDDGLAAVSCGLAMQRALAEVGTIQTPGGRVVELGMKVAVAAGRARRFVVGDPDVQLIDVLAGALVDRVAEAEHHTERGEVVVDAATAAALEGRIEVAEFRGEDPDAVTVVGSVVGGDPKARTVRPQPYPRLPSAVVRQWLLPAVYLRMRAGRGEFLAELRPAVPMFVRFGGIDYDTDEAPALLDEFIRRAQWVIDGHGGNLLQLTIGDKGAYLYAVFGSPLAHEDDAARACAAALDVLSLEGETAVTGLQLGISSGRLRSGTCGHRQRRTFCCLGDAVNMAARLMGRAPEGQVYVSTPVARAAGVEFTFEDVGTLSLKGKAAPVAVRRLAGRTKRSEIRPPRDLHPLIGRSEELDALLTRARLAISGRGQLLAVAAEAGMGKSRLLQEVVTRLSGGPGPSDPPVTVVSGAASAVGSATAYLAWQGVFGSLFGDGATNDLDQLAQVLGEANPALVARLPLLGAVLDRPIEDNELTSGFDAKLRKSSLETLLVQWLSWRAANGPLVMVLEDCHWMDQLSVDLLERVARALPGMAAALVVTYRPGSFTPPPVGHATVIPLDRLDDSSCRTLLADRLRDVYGPEVAPSSTVLDRLVERAEGNPFYLEELANYLHDEGADPSGDNPADVDLPSSLSALVLSRIDTLGESSRRTLKVASVVGREFATDVLTGAYPELGAGRQVVGHLRRLCDANLVVQDDEDAKAYWFKHAMVRDVAYDSLPFSLRALVHGRIGLWLESADPDALDLLAHHFWHADDDGKKRQYLHRAGEAARARFANAQAADYFRRLVSLLGDEDRAPVLRQLGAVLELPGLWSDAEAVYRELLDLAARLSDPVLAAWAHCSLAEPMRKQGHYDEASHELDVAEPSFDDAGDLDGLAQAAHVRGLIANQRGAPAEAWDHFQRSLDLRRRLGDRVHVASALANLAVAAANQGGLDLAWTLTEESLVLRTELGDRWGIQVSENNLAMVAYLRQEYARAVPHFEAALHIAHEIGDLLGIATAGDNLGNCARELGEDGTARARYAEALRVYAITGDQWLAASMFEDVAMLCASTEPEAALQLAGAADSLREAIGAARLDYRAAELDERLAPSLERLGDNGPAARQAGRALSADTGWELALSLCG